MRDRRLKRTVRVDVNAFGVPGNVRPFSFFPPPPTLSRYPRISKNGRWVVFTSDASNLVPNDTNGHENDVFRVDLNRFFAGPVVAVPSLKPMASLLLILGVLGAGLWVRRD